MNSIAASIAGFAVGASVVCPSCAVVRMPFGPDNIFGGLGYFYYRAGQTPTYAFHSNGEEVRVWDKTTGAIVPFEVNASDCPGLTESISRLIRDAGRSAAELANLPYRRPPDEIVTDEPVHSLVYYPPGRPDRLELTGLDHSSVQLWIATVKDVQKRINDCRDS